MRARHLSSNHRAARLGGVLAIALGVGLLALAVTSGEVDDGSSGVASPTTEDPDATVLGEVVERTTLPDAPPASAVGFTTTTDAAVPQTAAPVTTVPPSTTTPPPTLGPPVSVVRPTTTTSTATTQPPDPCDDPTTTTTEGQCDPPPSG